MIEDPSMSDRANEHALSRTSPGKIPAAATLYFGKKHANC